MSKNAKTGAEYRGENAEVLMRMELAAKYKHGTWATYKQWQELGFQVKKGEITPIVEMNHFRIKPMDI